MNIAQFLGDTSSGMRKANTGSSDLQWLPSLQVWARLPGKPQASCRPQAAPAASGLPPAPPVARQASEHSMEAKERDCPDSPSGSDAEDTILTCSICARPLLSWSASLKRCRTVALFPWKALSHQGVCEVPRCVRAGLSYVTDLRDKAVAEPCMHAFCVSCLSAWLKIKRSCPLCKARSARAPRKRRTELSFSLVERLPPAAAVQLTRRARSAGACEAIHVCHHVRARVLRGRGAADAAAARVLAQAGSFAAAAGPAVARARQRRGAGPVGPAVAAHGGVEPVAVARARRVWRPARRRPGERLRPAGAALGRRERVAARTAPVLLPRAGALLGVGCACSTGV